MTNKETAIKQLEDFISQYEGTVPVYGIEDAIKLLKTPDSKPLDEKENMYYIWSGQYLGNDLVWWGVDGKGYTSDIDKAGRYTFQKIQKLRPSDKAIECDYIDQLPHRIAIDAQKVDFRMFGKK